MFVNLTPAVTGAYIKEWNITSNTKFDGVRCEYVYMRLPTKGENNTFKFTGMEVVLHFPTKARIEHQPMRKFIIRLFIVILVLSGSMSYVFVNRATSASSCPITSLTAQVGNGTLSYSQVGNGRSILLLHGLFASKEQWNTMMCRLSEVGYRAIAAW